jgi:hypothetical protein
MDDTTDKFCNYKTTDCTVASTKDLYKGLNFPKRFECPCKFFIRSTYFANHHPSFFRLIQRIWDSTGAEKLHLQNNKLGLWILHSVSTLGSISVTEIAHKWQCFIHFICLFSGFIRWTNNSVRIWRQQGCTETTLWTRALISPSVINNN